MRWPAAPRFRDRQPHERVGPFVHVRVEERELGRAPQRRTVVVASFREGPHRFAASAESEDAPDEALRKLAAVPPVGWRPPWAEGASGFDVFVEDLVHGRRWSGWLNTITDLGSVVLRRGVAEASCSEDDDPS